MTANKPLKDSVPIEGLLSSGRLKSYILLRAGKKPPPDGSVRRLVAALQSLAVPKSNLGSASVALLLRLSSETVLLVQFRDHDIGVAIGQALHKVGGVIAGLKINRRELSQACV